MCWGTVKRRVRQGFLMGSSDCGLRTCTRDRVIRNCVYDTHKEAIQIHVQSGGKCLAVGKTSGSSNADHCR